MFENLRAKSRPAVLEIAAIAVAGGLVLFSIVGIVVSLNHAGDVMKASRAFAARPHAEPDEAPGGVTFVGGPSSASNSEIGHGQPPEPTIDLDVPVVCPDPSLSDRTGSQAAPVKDTRAGGSACDSGPVGSEGAGAGTVAPCDRDR